MQPLISMIYQIQAITAFREACAIWASSGDKTPPEAPILLPYTVHPCLYTRSKKSILKKTKPQYPISPQSDTRVTNDPVTSAPAPRVRFQYQVPAPPPRVHPKEAAPEVEPVARRTRPHTQTAEIPVTQSTRAQLNQYLMVTPYQAPQCYFPKDLLSLCTTPVTDLDMPVLDSEMGEPLEYHRLCCNPKYQNIWEESY